MRLFQTFQNKEFQNKYATKSWQPIEKEISNKKKTPALRDGVDNAMSEIQYETQKRMLDMLKSNPLAWLLRMADHPM